MTSAFMFGLAAPGGHALTSMPESLTDQAPEAT